MVRDEIIEIGIDAEGRLYLVPKSKKFPFIYRETKEVSWHPERKCLYSPKPREWSYARWYNQIVNTAKEQSCILSISENAKWVAIPESLKIEILGLSIFASKKVT